MAGEDGVFDLRHDRVVVADDAVEDALAGAEPREQVPAHLLAYGDDLVPCSSQLADRTRMLHRSSRKPKRRGHYTRAVSGE